MIEDFCRLLYVEPSLHNGQIKEKLGICHTNSGQQIELPQSAHGDVPLFVEHCEVYWDISI
jgi:hypothetical protein